MTATTDIPEPGAIVRVRQRLYLVDDVAAAPRPGDATVVRMSCVDDDAQGQALDVLWELELDAQVVRAESWESLVNRGFDPPDQFGAYLNTLRWNCVTATDPSLLQSPFRAGIRLDPYQLEPLRKALRLPRVVSKNSTGRECVLFQRVASGAPSSGNRRFGRSGW